MEFFNKKEEVFDIELTPHGKYLLSLGIMEPVYYGFFDEDILYDAEGGGVFESQHAADRRIRYETPALKRPADTNSAQTRAFEQAGMQGILPAMAGGTPGNVSENSIGHAFQFGTNSSLATSDIGRVMRYMGALANQPAGLALDAGFAPVVSAMDVLTSTLTGGSTSTTGTTAEELAAIGNLLTMPPGAGGVDTSLDTHQIRAIQPIGTSDLKSSSPPAWKITCIENSISSSQSYYVSNLTSSDVPLANGYVSPIPQINIEVDYQTFYAKESDAVFFDSPKITQLTPVFNSTGQALFLKENYVLLEIEEQNAPDGKENFDIEVYGYGNQIGFLTVQQLPFGGIVTSNAVRHALAATAGAAGTTAMGATSTAGSGLGSMMGLGMAGIVSSLRNTVEKFLNISVDEEIPDEVLNAAGISLPLRRAPTPRMALTRDLYGDSPGWPGDGGDPCDD